MEPCATARFLRTPWAWWWSLSLHTGILENFTHHDCIMIGMGHQPGNLTFIISTLEVHISKLFKRCRWSVVTVLQTCTKGPDYAEYFGVGMGKEYKGTLGEVAVPPWIGLSV